MIEQYGYQETCPNCAGLLWINLKWPGLPQWTFNEDGSLSENFMCPWCESVCAIGPNSVLSIENMANHSRRITSDQVLLIDSGHLAVLLCRLLYNQVNNKEGILKIGGAFADEQELMKWCANVVSPVYKSNKLIRLPALPI